MAKGGGFEPIEVTADVGIVATGADLAELFANAARGMWHYVLDTAGVQPTGWVRVELVAPRVEELLVAWLNELLYRFEVDGFVPVEYRFPVLEGRRLVAELRGERLDPTRHALRGHIKATTYHGLEVRRDPEGWQARVIFDV